MKSRVPLAVALLALISIAPATQGQEATIYPSDPKELMLAATRLNNLTTPDMKPWHMKATFQTFDQNGAVTNEGAFDEWWANPQQSKQVLTGKSFSETDYTTGKGDFRAASHGDVPPILNSIQGYLISPLPNERTIESSIYSLKPVETGSLKLTCVTPEGLPGAGSFCLSSSEPILRIYAIPSSSTQALYNRILRFQGKDFAGDFKLTRDGKVTLTLHVDTIESLDPANQSAFTPAQDETLVPILRTVFISAGVAAAMIEYKVRPDYPIEAKNAHITGTVVLQASIGKDGHIHDLKVVSGPKILQFPATDAVRQWRYRPYLLNGDPVEVMTTINVIFSLGG